MCVFERCLSYFYSSCLCFCPLFFPRVYSVLNVFLHIIYSSAVQQDFLHWRKYSVISVQYCNHEPHVAIKFWIVVWLRNRQHAACGISVPQPEIEPIPTAHPHSPAVWSPNRWTAGESLRNTVSSLEVNSTCGQRHCINSAGLWAQFCTAGALAQLLVTPLLGWICPLACCFLSPAGVVLFA